jgi:hypothetical protein
MDTGRKRDTRNNGFRHAGEALRPVTVRSAGRDGNLLADESLTISR